MLVDSGSSFEIAVHALLKESDYGLDTETSGVFWHDSLFSIILATNADSYYFNFNNKQEAPCLDRSFIKNLQPLFRKGATFFISNAKFDMRMLRKERLKMHGDFFCTNAHGRVLKNNYFGGSSMYSLAASARRLGEEKDDAVDTFIMANNLYTREKIPGKKRTWLHKRYWQVPLDIMQPYGEKDARLHLKVGKHLQKQINNTEKGVFKHDISHISDNELRLTKVCHDMEYSGVRVDLEYIKSASAFEKNALNRALLDFKNMAAGEEFRDSNKFLAAIFAKAGYKELPKTDKGNPSFTDAVLETLSGPLAEGVRKIRHHAKRDGTYYSSFLHFVDAFDRIHPDMKQGGTETGRFSYSDPNLQNVPKEETVEDVRSCVRKCFIPDPDHAFVMIDYSQQEYRLMLDYAGETGLIREVMAGADVHQAMADLVGISRQQAKTLNFACLYGSGPSKLAGMLSITEADAKELLGKYYSRLPRVKRFKEAVIQKGRVRGYITNWAGRRCYISNRDWAYILPNHLIQGGGADIIKFAMVKIHDFLRGKKSYMCLQVHDELILNMHKDEFDLIPKVKEIMENVYQPMNGMKLAADVEHSFVSWGSIDKKKGLPI
jgi:DNA polymerase-1